MAKRGRKPAAVKAARPVVSPAAWDVPAHLTGEAVAAWRHVVGMLDATGNLDKTDPTLVEAYAVNVAMLRAAQADIDRNGVTTENSRGAAMPNPACAIANAASMRIKSIVSDLGLCPASSKLAQGKHAKPEDAKWGGLLGVVGG